MIDLKNKTLLVFSFGKNIKWIKKKIQKLAYKFTEIIIVVEDSNIQIFDDSNDYNIKTIAELIDSKLYEDRDKFLNDNTRRFTENILSQNFFEENFIIDGINTWWFIAPRILSFLKKEDILEIIYVVNKLVKQIKPRFVLIDSNFMQTKIIKHICYKNSIPFKSSITNYKKLKNTLYKILVKLFSGMKRKHKAKLLAKWAKRSVNKNITDSKKTKKIIFISQERANRIEYTLKYDLTKHDIYNHNIQTTLHEMGDFELYSIELISNLKQMKVFEQLRNELIGTKRLPLYYFHNTSIQRKVSSLHRRLRTKLMILINDVNFRKTFIFDKISLVDIFDFHFLRLFLTYITIGMEIFYYYLKAFEEIQPNVFVHYNEHSIFGNAAILATKIKDIPIVALQHGNISFASNGYLYSKGLICPKKESNLAAKCRHISTITTVYGEAVKAFLVKEAGYPEERLLITGCPRWDVIKHKKLFNRKSFLEKLNLDSKKKVITIFSQKLIKREDRIYFNNEVLKAIKTGLEDVEIIWKPHPRENIQEIQTIIKKHGIKNIHLEKDLPLFDVLNASDLAITVHSTVGLEAMLFDKPVITLIPPGEEENNLFKNTGATIKVDNHNDLAQTLQLVLFDKSTQANIKNNRDKLLKKLVRFDDKASKRNAELIEKMVKLTDHKI